MKEHLLLRLLLVLCSVVGNIQSSRSKMVQGTIQENTPWFLHNLSQVPAMNASIWYRVQYPIVEDAPTPIITFYNKGQNSTNLRDKCNTDIHNNNLSIPLIRKHGENFRCNSVKSKTWNCHGEFEIQDFKATPYLFSIGYECGDTAGNLEGLFYKVTIFDESGTTEEGTTRLLSNLSVRPAMTSSIEYYIRLIICFLSLALI